MGKFNLPTCHFTQVMNGQASQSQTKNEKQKRKPKQQINQVAGKRKEERLKVTCPILAKQSYGKSST